MVKLTALIEDGPTEEYNVAADDAQLILKTLFGRAEVYNVSVHIRDPKVTPEVEKGSDGQDGEKEPLPEWTDPDPVI